jgi:hypothetical protein
MQQPSTNMMQSPALYNALARMGSAILIANDAGKGLGGSLGYGLQAFGDAQTADAQQRLTEAQIRQTEAASMPKGPFSGDGFDNQMASAQYQYYLSQGADELTARQRAINDVLASKPQYQMVTDAAGNVRMMPVPRGSVPTGPISAPSAPAMPGVAQSDVLPPPSFQEPQGGLLPPPAAMGAGETQMPSSMFAGNPKAQQAQMETQARIQGERAANGGTLPLTEAQGQAAARAQLLQQGLQGYESTLFNPEVRPAAMAAADTVSALGPLGRLAAGSIRNDTEAQLNAAQAKALEAMAASVTGAGVTQDQFDRFSSMLPSAYEGDATKRVKLKAAYDYLLGLSNLTGDMRGQLQERIKTMAENSKANQGPPAGISGAEWNAMTPEEKALFQ